MEVESYTLLHFIQNIHTEFEYYVFIQELENYIFIQELEYDTFVQELESNI